ncbi:hypothetical protein D3C78_1888470 [compost metagenome]
MTRPIPALKPVSTGNEMKFATNPSRSAEAAIKSTPVSAVSVAVAVINRSVFPSGATSASWLAVRIASVVVELTLSTLEVPNRA